MTECYKKISQQRLILSKHELEEMSSGCMFYQGDDIGSKYTRIVVVSPTHFYKFYSKQADITFTELPLNWLGIDNSFENNVKPNSFITHVKEKVPYYYSCIKSLPLSHICNLNLITIRMKKERYPFFLATFCCALMLPSGHKIH